jgi:type I restriction enzyme S subunit
VNNHAHILTAKDGLADLYYLKSVLDISNISGFITGAAQPKLTQENLRRIPVPLPPLPTQRKIADILSAYDDLIENNTRRIAILEEMAQRLYQEWFVHFRYPGHEHVPLVDSELGPIPEGWEVKRLGEVLKLEYGKALRAEDRMPGPFPVFGSSGVVGFHDAALVAGPGVVVGRKGNVGSVHWSERDFYPIDTVFYVRSDYSLCFIYFALRNQRFLNSDAAVPGLNRNQAYLTRWIVPPKAQVSAFTEIVQPIFDLLSRLGDARDLLATIRDYILRELLREATLTPATPTAAATSSNPASTNSS